MNNVSVKRDHQNILKEKTTQLHETHFKYDTGRLKAKGWKKIHNVKN